MSFSFIEIGEVCEEDKYLCISLNFPEIDLPYEQLKTNNLGQLGRQIRTSASNDGLGFLK